MSMVARTPAAGNQPIKSLPRCAGAAAITQTTIKRKFAMPIVTVQVTREGSTPGRDTVTADEKAAIIKGVSEVLLNVLNKPLESTYVVIEEVDLDNWGWGGLPTVQYRQQRAAAGKF
jgi:4-oxalocrotonate tautomerase